MGISIDEVRGIATLARLRLETDELTTLAAQLNSILEHFERLQRVDVTGVSPDPGPGAGESVLRPDDPVPTGGAEAALAGAPQVAAGHFRVPRVIG